MLIDPFRFGSPPVPPGGTLELLVHMTSDFADSSGNGRTPTVNSATVNSSQTLFGFPTGNFGGTVSYPDAANLDIGTQAFTLEGWLFLSALPSSPSRTVASHSSNTNFNFNSHEFYVYITPSGGIEISVGVPSNAEVKAASAGSTVPTGAWFHWAACRGGGTLDLYLGGSRVATNSILDTTSITAASSALILGGPGADAGSFGQLSCRMGQVRYTQGARIYSGTTYTVPTGPFPDP